MARLLLLAAMLLAVPVGGCDAPSPGGTAAPGGTTSGDVCALVAEADLDVILAEVDPGDPDSVRVAYEKGAEAAARLVEEAPEEVRADAAVVSGALTQYLASLDEAGFDPARADASILADADVQAAAEGLGSYAASSC